ncbi:MAG: oxidoreductase [Lachnospiraceae bacterium]|nr:oxidoreductase [Lachnospiraceae bacterium]MBR6356686.1 oxidoreductase [Lachnospiraceae bacterium]
MTEFCSKNTSGNELRSIAPDGISGMIFTMEGIRNSVILLNGPMGCKFYHSTTSQFLMPRPALYLPVKEGDEAVEVRFDFLNEWFFRQPRVPCTWLDGHDYVYGTLEKVTDGLRYIKEHVPCDLITVVNAPGASLIGDDPREICREIFPDIPAIVLESPGFSTEYYDGCDTAILELFRQAGDRLWKDAVKEDADSSRKPTVNILGISIWQKYALGDMNEIRRILSLCGIDVNTILCAGCTVDEIRKIPEADLNIVLYPEMGLSGAKWLQQNLGMPYYVCEVPPIGFDATAVFAEEISQLLKTDCSKVKEEIEIARAKAWYSISGIYNACGKPDGTIFAVKSFPSQEKGITQFLSDYLGMIADTSDISHTKAEVVFSDANIISELMLRDKEFCGIEIANPTMGYVDVIEKTLLGINGALFLTEQVLNSFMTRII